MTVRSPATINRNARAIKKFRAGHEQISVIAPYEKGAFQWIAARMLPRMTHVRREIKAFVTPCAWRASARGWLLERLPHLFLLSKRLPTFGGKFSERTQH